MKKCEGCGHMSDNSVVKCPFCGSMRFTNNTSEENDTPSKYDSFMATDRDEGIRMKRNNPELITMRTVVYVTTVIIGGFGWIFVGWWVFLLCNLAEVIFGMYLLSKGYSHSGKIMIISALVMIVATFLIDSSLSDTFEKARKGLKRL